MTHRCFAAPSLAVLLLVACSSEEPGAEAPFPSPASGGTGAPGGGTGGAEGGAAPGGAPPLAALSLARGINLGSALDAPTEGEWGVVLEEAHFAQAAAAGFDHVRLPVRFDAHAATTPPYAIDPAFLERVDWALATAQSHGLGVVLDWHHYQALKDDPDGERARFLAGWELLAERYAAQPASVAFELLNEPCCALGAARWGTLFAEALAVVRATNPERTVIVDSPEWSNAPAFGSLVAPDDPHLVLSFHMYEPHLFTVQGATWMEAEFSTVGVVFPGPPPTPVEPLPAAASASWAAQWFSAYNTKPGDANPASEATVRGVICTAAAIARERGKPAYVGELAVVDWADLDSRARWYRAVRTEAEAQGLGWAVWDDGGHNQVMNVSEGTWVEPLRSALLDP